MNNIIKNETNCKMYFKILKYYIINNIFQLIYLLLNDLVVNLFFIFMLEYFCLINII